MENEFLDDDGMRQIRGRRRFQTGLVILLILFCMDAGSPRPYDVRVANQEEDTSGLCEIIKKLPSKLLEPGGEKLELESKTRIMGNWTSSSSVRITRPDMEKLPPSIVKDMRGEPIDATSGGLRIVMNLVPIRDRKWDPHISLVYGQVQLGKEVTKSRDNVVFQGLFFHKYGRLVALGGLGSGEKWKIVWDATEETDVPQLTPRVASHVGETRASNDTKMSMGQSGTDVGDDDEPAGRKALRVPGSADAGVRGLEGTMMDELPVPASLERKVDGQDDEGSEEGGGEDNEDDGKPNLGLSSRSEEDLGINNDPEAVGPGTLGDSLRQEGSLELTYVESTTGDMKDSALPGGGRGGDEEDFPVMILPVTAIDLPGQRSEATNLKTRTHANDEGGCRFMFTLQAQHISDNGLGKGGMFSDRMQGELQAINCDFSAKLDVQIDRQSATLAYTILFAALCLLQMCLLFCRVSIMLAHRRYGRSFLSRQRNQVPKFDYHRPLPPDWGANERMSETAGGEDSEKGRDLETGRSPECTICYAAVDATLEDYMLTPCDHVFHQACLTRWMNIKMECPTCRHELPPQLD